MEEFTKKAVELCTEAGSKLILALLVWLIGKAVVSKLLKVLSRAKVLSAMDETVRKFILSIIRGVLYTVLIVSIIGILGVPMASIVTVLATCGVAVGMALQGALGNLAGGIMLMIFRPFSVGDIINAAGADGVVHEISMFYTKLRTPDGTTITIPNGSLMGANVTNFSAQGKRRIDVVFSVAKDTNIDQAEEIIRTVLKDTPNVLVEDGVTGAVAGGTNEALNLLARCWVKPENYAPTSAAITEGVTRAFGKAGFKAPAARIVTDK